MTKKKKIAALGLNIYPGNESPAEPRLYTHDSQLTHNENIAEWNVDEWNLPAGFFCNAYQ